MRDFKTPSIVVDLDILEQNIKHYQAEANKHNKQLWPMMKTHKSTEILKMQIEQGATGVLCGTLDEAELCLEAGVNNIMYAYPVVNIVNVMRVVELSKKCNFIIRIDNIESAMAISDCALKNDTVVNYSIIIDSGLGRFGIPVQNAVEFARKCDGLAGIKLCAISTHPGHVYSATNADEVEKCAKDERAVLKEAATSLRAAGFELEYVTSGSTATFLSSVGDDCITVFHPGNYVFFDVIQIALGAAKEENCALKIRTNIISNPSDNTFLCDAGSKCLGLDTGGHGNSSLCGFGRIEGYPELIVKSLSEEVGKIYATDKSRVKIGDILEIIPNHSCSSGNLTSFYCGERKGKFEKYIKVDARCNSRQ